MDLSKLNPLEWGKNIFKELENVRYCYFLAFLAVYSSMFFIPDNLIKKLELFKYISILSLLAIFSIIILLARLINFASFKLEKHFKEKEILKHLTTLNQDELKTLSLGVVENQKTIYMNFEDSAGISLMQKGLIIKCDGTQNYEGFWPYIIPNFVWDNIIKNSKFKEKTKEEILALNKK